MTANPISDSFSHGNILEANISLTPMTISIDNLIPKAMTRCEYAWMIYCQIAIFSIALVLNIYVTIWNFTSERQAAALDGCRTSDSVYRGRSQNSSEGVARSASSIFKLSISSSSAFPNGGSASSWPVLKKTYSRPSIYPHNCTQRKLYQAVSINVGGMLISMAMLIEGITFMFVDPADSTATNKCFVNVCYMIVHAFIYLGYALVLGMHIFTSSKNLWYAMYPMKNANKCPNPRLRLVCLAWIIAVIVVTTDIALYVKDNQENKLCQSESKMANLLPALALAESSFIDFSSLAAFVYLIIVKVGIVTVFRRSNSSSQRPRGHFAQVSETLALHYYQIILFSTLLVITFYDTAYFHKDDGHKDVEDETWSSSNLKSSVAYRASHAIFTLSRPLWVLIYYYIDKNRKRLRNSSAMSVGSTLTDRNSSNSFRTQGLTPKCLGYKRPSILNEEMFPKAQSVQKFNIHGRLESITETPNNCEDVLYRSTPASIDAGTLSNETNGSDCFLQLEKRQSSVKRKHRLSNFDYSCQVDHTTSTPRNLKHKSATNNGNKRNLSFGQNIVASLNSQPQPVHYFDVTNIARKLSSYSNKADYDESSISTKLPNLNDVTYQRDDSVNSSRVNVHNNISKTQLSLDISDNRSEITRTHSYDNKADQRIRQEKSRKESTFTFNVPSAVLNEPIIVVNSKQEEKSYYADCKANGCRILFDSDNFKNLHACSYEDLCDKTYHIRPTQRNKASSSDNISVLAIGHRKRKIGTSTRPNCTEFRDEIAESHFKSQHQLHNDTSRITKIETNHGRKNSLPVPNEIKRATVLRESNLGSQFEHLIADIAYDISRENSGKSDFEQTRKRKNGLAGLLLSKARKMPFQSSSPKHYSGDDGVSGNRRKSYGFEGANLINSNLLNDGYNSKLNSMNSYRRIRQREQSSSSNYRRPAIQNESTTRLDENVTNVVRSYNFDRRKSYAFESNSSDPCHGNVIDNLRNYSFSSHIADKTPSHF